MKKVFIDGKAGTTGLRIYERLGERDDIELIFLFEGERKDTECRKKALNSCDVAFLCLPDDAAREAVSMIENEAVVVIDTSTAHRTDADWVYGFPQLSEKHRERIKSSKRISVPGCHASGFLALIFPLVEKGVISPDSLLTCFSLTGYSGGGRKMIEEYEDEGRNKMYDAPRQYGLSQQHKHLKEMRIRAGLKNDPVFCPIVSDFYSGMEVTIPLFRQNLKEGCTLSDIRGIYKNKYNGDTVSYRESMDENGFMSANALEGKDSMEITVMGNEDRILLIARYDNLGKGASGAAIECLNLVI